MIEKTATLAAKAELEAKQDKIIELKAFDQVIFDVKAILKMIVLKII